MKRRWWPPGLAGQLAGVLLLALVVAQGLSLLIFADERRLALRELNREQVLTRTAGLVRLLGETPPELQGRILAAASSGALSFRIEPESAVDPGPAPHAKNRLARRLAGLVGGEAGRTVLVELRDERRLRRLVGFEPIDRATGRPRHWREHRAALALLISVRLADGSWLNAGTAFPAPPRWAGPSLVSLALSAGLVTLATILAVRRLTQPMGRLAAAADALGRGEAVAALPEAGPSDIRRTTRAFNRMQARLLRFVDDRTRMLAAISHDLRTPITSLRLRAELVEDEENRGRMLGTLDEMQRIVEASLQFAGEAASREATRVVDLAALVESVVADLADLGGAATFRSSPRTPYACRPASLRRAVRNLVENALAYGGAARVELALDRAGVRIVVEDDGPGIPEAMQERVFEPFVRLEASRSRETGGTGLGLAIARTIARGHGGDIGLRNRPEGGLAATLTLPADGRSAG